MICEVILAVEQNKNAARQPFGNSSCINKKVKSNYP